jgi:hypothetical protein
MRTGETPDPAPVVRVLPQPFPTALLFVQFRQGRRHDFKGGCLLAVQELLETLVQADTRYHRHHGKGKHHGNYLGKQNPGKQRFHGNILHPLYSVVQVSRKISYFSSQLVSFSGAYSPCTKKIRGFSATDHRRF